MAEEAELNLDEELEELESRLERLRALYEQYFLGIEKLEPTVPRKDVERRIWVLRRVKFKNTGKRFKFNVLTQRFNTFAQYWARICREIENGTYKRHLLKAEKAFGEPLTIAAKRRKGDFSKKKEEEAPPIEPSVEPPVDSLDAMLGLKPTRVPTAPGTTLGPFAQKPSEAPTRPGRFQLEKLDLDIDDIIGGGSAPISKRPQGPVGPVRARPAAPAAVPPAIEPPPLSGPPISRPGGAKAPPPVGPMIGARPRMPKGMVPPTEAPAEPPPRAEAEKPRPPPVPARAKPAPPPLPPRSIPPAAPGKPAPAAAGPSRPVARPPVAPPPSVRPAPARPAPAAGGLSEDRVKEIHSRLLDAKRQTNDGKSVSLDGLSKQLRATEDKLRQQHGNRKIDFDVVIKDGKAVVKPIVK